MRRVVLLVLAMTLVACNGDSGAESTTSTSAVASTTVVPTTAPVEDCAPIPYEVGELPERVVDEVPDPEDVPQDVFTTVPGTISRLWLDEDGNLVVVFVRGSLPPIEWPGDRG
jgi:hypothetical protein